jgi:hypothetical protein
MITDTVAKQNINLAQATLGNEMGQPMYSSALKDSMRCPRSTSQAGTAEIGTYLIKLGKITPLHIFKQDFK